MGFLLYCLLVSLFSLTDTDGREQSDRLIRGLTLGEDISEWVEDIIML